jgi:acyl dehydratase
MHELETQTRVSRLRIRVWRASIDHPIFPEPFAMAGLYFEQFLVGHVFKHAVTRTITEADNTLFSVMTLNMQPLHLDAHFAAQTEFGQRLVNSLFTLGLVIGISVSDTTLGTTIANLGMNDVRFPKPLFHGDTVRVETEVISVRDSRSRPNAGIVEFEHRGFNQHGDLICSCRRSAFMRRTPEV